MYRPAEVDNKGINVFIDRLVVIGMEMMANASGHCCGGGSSETPADIAAAGDHREHQQT